MCATAVLAWITEYLASVSGPRYTVYIHISAGTCLVLPAILSNRKQAQLPQLTQHITEDAYVADVTLGGVHVHKVHSSRLGEFRIR